MDKNGPGSCFQALAESQATLQHLLLVVTWKPLWSTMGYYQREGRHLPAESSMPCSLSACNVGAGVPAEYFAIWVEMALLCSGVFFFCSPSNMTELLVSKCQQCLERRGGRREEVQCLFLSPFWRLVWLSSARLKGWQLRLWVYREGEDEEAKQERQKSKEKT